MSAEQALAPKLTRTDRRVLELLPLWGTGEPSPAAHELVSAHQAAEAIGTDDVRFARDLLHGLEQLGYATSAQSRSRKVRVWFRTEWTRGPDA